MAHALNHLKSGMTAAGAVGGGGRIATVYVGQAASACPSSQGKSAQLAEEAFALRTHLMLACI